MICAQVLKDAPAFFIQAESEMVRLICVLSVLLLPWAFLQKCLVNQPLTWFTLYIGSEDLLFLSFCAWLSLAAITLSFCCCKSAFHSEIASGVTVILLQFFSQAVKWYSLIIVHPSRWNHHSFNVLHHVHVVGAFLPISYILHPVSPWCLQSPVPSSSSSSCCSSKSSINCPTHFSHGHLSACLSSLPE